MVPVLLENFLTHFLSTRSFTLSLFERQEGKEASASKAPANEGRNIPWNGDYHPLPSEL